MIEKKKKKIASGIIITPGVKMHADLRKNLSKVACIGCVIRTSVGMYIYIYELCRRTRHEEVDRGTKSARLPSGACRGCGMNIII